MLILITYDVNVTTKAGRARLRKVANICLDYGQRVQNSVFECILTSDQYVKLKDKLKTTINKETDSVRLYRLGTNWKPRVETIGLETSFDLTGTLIV